MVPRVTVYNEISLDGRTTVFAGDVFRYYKLSFHWKVDAILMGSATALKPDEAEEEATAEPLPHPPRNPLPPGWDVPLYQPRPLLVVPDSRGRIHNWRSFQAEPWWRGMVALCSAETPSSYLTYLRKRQVDYIVAGEERVDLRAALEKLNELYAVKTILTDGGGSLNGALLRAGLVQEVSVLLNPCLVGGMGTPTLVDFPETPTADRVIRLELKSLERFADGVLWLRYDVLSTKGAPS